MSDWEVLDYLNGNQEGRYERDELEHELARVEDELYIAQYVAKHYVK